MDSYTRSQLVRNTFVNEAKYLALTPTAAWNDEIHNTKSTFLLVKANSRMTPSSVISMSLCIYIRARPFRRPLLNGDEISEFSLR